MAMGLISSPRKGTELEPRVFARWQEQVARALRLELPLRATLTAFTWGLIPAHEEARTTLTFTGARRGASVLVTPTQTPPPDVALGGYCDIDDTVTVRGFNVSVDAFSPPPTNYEVLVWNPL